MSQRHCAGARVRCARECRWQLPPRRFATARGRVRQFESGPPDVQRGSDERRQRTLSAARGPVPERIGGEDPVHAGDHARDVAGGTPLHQGPRRRRGESGAVAGPERRANTRSPRLSRLTSSRERTGAEIAAGARAP